MRHRAPYKRTRLQRRLDRALIRGEVGIDDLRRLVEAGGIFSTEYTFRKTRPVISSLKVSLDAVSDQADVLDCKPADHALRLKDSLAAAYAEAESLRREVANDIARHREDMYMYSSAYRRYRDPLSVRVRVLRRHRRVLSGARTVAREIRAAHVLMDTIIVARAYGVIMAPAGISVRCMVNAAVCLLPAAHRSRYAEEFRSELADLPRPLLPYAFRLMWRVGSLRRSLASLSTAHLAESRES